MKPFLDGLKALGPARLAALGLVGAATLGLLGLLALRGGGEHKALLYADLDTREAAQIADTLEHAHIAHEVGGAGSEILVPSDQVSRARILLAKDGLPSGGSIGYEIFDRGDSLTASQFQQSINQTRALEGELERTIHMISGIRAARVHLVLPRREPFAREQQVAQASVVLALAGTTRLDREQVQAILHLVAAAVPGLHPQQISIIDNHGQLLARTGEPTGPDAAAQSTEELRSGIAMRLSRAVEQMLESTVGAGHVRVEASVELDLDQVRETQERFDPDGQVVRSSQTVTNNSKSTDAGQTVSVQNNLPNADAGGSGAGSQEKRQEETTNYEIGKTVRTLVREQPEIKRLSLAVLVDGIEIRGADGSVAWKERATDDLDRIARLVRSAVGFDERRGDKIEVVNMRFADEATMIAPASDGVLGLHIGTADLLRLAQSIVPAAVGTLALLLVLRPMVLRLTALPAAGVLAAATVGGDANVLVGPSGAIAALSSAAPRITGPAEPPAVEAAERLISVNNVEGQLRASSIRRVADLVSRHPDESLSIVRAWMDQDAS